jgi:lipoyl(octanoyl) transferase
VKRPDVANFSDDLSEHIEMLSSRHPSRSGTLLEFAEPVPYAEAWRLQMRLREERAADRRLDTLLLLEHSPVYTVGRTTQASHWSNGEELLSHAGIQIHSVDRGGSVTYHGPGQLVGYPILRLSHYASGPRQYVRLLEEVLIETLRSWGLQGYRVDNKPGVWIRLDDQDAKIAAIGVRIERGVTLHGFALNVDMDLSPFSRIVPCGLTGCRITSMADALRSTVSFTGVRSVLQRTFSRTFNIEWTSVRTAQLTETLAMR